MISIIAAALAFAAPAGLADDVLAKADANKDGLVTRQELIDARVAAFKRADRNGDGVVDNGDAPNRPALAAQYRQQAGAFKKQFDLNGDGVVTLEEVKSAPTTYFDLADANKDGALDKTELETAKAAAKAART